MIGPLTNKLEDYYKSQKRIRKALEGSHSWDARAYISKYNRDLKKSEFYRNELRRVKKRRVKFSSMS